ncbi:bifunctional DNA-formamidopyrimidine glycosylase/DNA-(apurinic or apyrimidinic site) lyase [Streptomyces buecherae]|uniref:Formamidopyrimidine-DNA glycosylase n=1 Tax=Streptomyces buecherae TaxID=2763006 RepID=A0A7H8NDS7_9ACTN|nr:bifunctional DNA-formamidopyrimidine glycosylase/DNA-(apurinic or apyrimidinic site) lyase [Streptomyces buecherae]QKW52629.1 bifunctional DNA-formamidopyrimidine glycosylase/DNA-(apurinic or apyrimidinic site) lyase [Streptomyces buecherae]
MPELPEVEVVRRGLERWVTGRVIADVQVLHPRAIRRHLAGPADFADQLIGHRFAAACRRGKYLWLPLDAVGADATAPTERPVRAHTGLADGATGHGATGDGALPTERGARGAGHGAPGPADGAVDGATGGGATGRSVLGHLGMSGQLLVQPETAADEKHLRIRVRFADAVGTELRFVDQRTFGGLSLHDQLPGAPDGLPDVIGHIARDPLDPAFDEAAFYAALRRRRTTIKRALLDQSLISGVGNIYADEALWRARLHFDRPTASLTRPRAIELLGHVRDVMRAALAVGGTSFDSLYVNVNGESGYFERSLDAYGREDEPCRRCGAPMRRSPWMNRSSYFCPRCQRPPRVVAPRTAGSGPTV